MLSMSWRRDGVIASRLSTSDSIPERIRRAGWLPVKRTGQEPLSYEDAVGVFEELYEAYYHKVAAVSYTHLTLPTIYSV